MKKRGIGLKTAKYSEMTNFDLRKGDAECLKA